MRKALKEARMAAGMTQQKTADLIGISHPSEETAGNGLGKKKHQRLILAEYISRK